MLLKVFSNVIVGVLWGEKKKVFQVILSYCLDMKSGRTQRAPFVSPMKAKFISLAARADFNSAKEFTMVTGGPNNLIEKATMSSLVRSPSYVNVVSPLMLNNYNVISKVKPF